MFTIDDSVSHFIIIVILMLLFHSVRLLGKKVLRFIVYDKDSITIMRQTRESCEW